MDSCTYWLILLFTFPPLWRAGLFVKLLNYQWVIGSNWPTAATGSNKSITHEFHMSTFCIFRSKSIVSVHRLVWKWGSCSQVWRIWEFRLHGHVVMCLGCFFNPSCRSPVPHFWFQVYKRSPVPFFFSETIIEAHHGRGVLEYCSFSH